MIKEDYYVYAYIHPITGMPFYVGKGRGTRAVSHLNHRGEKGKNKLKDSIIQKIKDMDNDPVIEFLGDGLTEDAAFDLEIKSIKRWGRIDLGTGTLANFTDGGDGASGLKHKEESKKKMSKSRTGIIPSEETRKKISDANSGKPKSIESRRKISIANTGKVRTEEFKKRISIMFKGRKQTDEQRERSAEGLRAFWKTENGIEALERIRLSHVGKKRSEETKRNISESKKGKKWDDDRRKKFSELQKRRVRDGTSSVFNMIAANRSAAQKTGSPM